MHRTYEEWDKMVNSGCSLKDYIGTSTPKKLETSYQWGGSFRLVCPLTGKARTHNEAAREGWVEITNKNFSPSILRIHPDGLNNPDVILNVRINYYEMS